MQHAVCEAAEEQAAGEGLILCVGHGGDEFERRTEGVNTYVTLKASNGKTYACTVNGGNLFSFGMTNPPVCNAR